MKNENDNITKKLHARFQYTIEMSPEAIFWMERNGQFSYVNEQACNSLGYTKEELHSLFLWDIDPDYPTERWDDQWATLKRVGKKTFETRHRRKDGYVFPVEVSACQVTFEGIEFHAAFVRDITERKKAEEENVILIAQLQNKTEEQERFIYTASHDLKSPLITISGFAEIVERDLLSGNQERAKESLNEISTAALHMSQLLDDLLELSRVGVLKNKKEVVNLGALITESTDNLSGVINEFNATIEVESELPDVMVDKQRFLQVFENLIINAIRYSKEAKGGSVAKVGVIRGEGELTCYVMDNGIGIDAEYLDQIFGLFKRLDTGTSGTGVGLAIVKRIVETHGGRIWAESKGLGHGTTLFFTLPEAK